MAVPGPVHFAVSGRQVADGQVIADTEARVAAACGGGTVIVWWVAAWPFGDGHRTVAWSPGDRWPGAPIALCCGVRAIDEPT